jgi:gp16 family phage-associated protein
LLLLHLAQPSIEIDQTTLDICKSGRIELGFLERGAIVHLAIQHAYYSIKCIAETALWGVANRIGMGVSPMDLRLCCDLRPVAGSVVRHGFQDASDRPLVILRNAAKLVYQTVFNFRKRLIRQSLSGSVNNVRNVKIKQRISETQVGRRRITGARFVVALGTFGHAKFFSQLILSQASTCAKFAQPGANLFGESQYFSTRIFTLAIFCHILRSSSHENAEICTMPNTSITEQARIKAREELEKRGQSAKDFAALHKLSPSTVYAVLSGQSKCRRGEAHRAAVLLGVKQGVIEQ